MGNMLCSEAGFPVNLLENIWIMRWENLSLIGKMKNMFDYIFYRLYKLYATKEKGGPTLTSANAGVCILQVLLLFCIVMTIDFILATINEAYYDPFRKFIRQFRENNVKVVGVIVLLLWDGISYFYYKKRYKMLIKKYKNHPLNKTFKVWYLYFVGAGLVAFPFILHKILMLIFG